MGNSRITCEYDDDYWTIPEGSSFAGEEPSWSFGAEVAKAKEEKGIKLDGGSIIEQVIAGLILLGVGIAGGAIAAHAYDVGRERHAKGLR